ncbi:MAG: methyltransferase domain-containing protein [Thermoplasmata archaeon]|nr:methyltransferase domain-containing protein [Thermoplasmata archaeon]MCI4356136.1 methyltransferase domain-containing protein [Thermoplasmata archaeon]
MTFAELERAAWNDPKVAVAYAALWRDFVAPSIPQLLDAALVGPGDSVLDVAAGPGPVSAAAAARGARPVALDFSMAMLRLGDPAIPKIRAGAARIPARDATFDRVVSNLGLLHLPEPDAAIREAARVVRPGGVVAFSVWGPDALALTIVPRALADLGLVRPGPAGPGFFRFGEPGAFEAAMRDAGLVPMESSRVAWNGPLASSDALWRMFHEGSARTRAAILALSEADQARLKDEVVRRVESFREGDRYAVPTTVVIGRGRRP